MSVSPPEVALATPPELLARMRMKREVNAAWVTQTTYLSKAVESKSPEKKGCDSVMD